MTKNELGRKEMEANGEGKERRKIGSFRLRNGHTRRISSGLGRLERVGMGQEVIKILETKETTDKAGLGDNRRVRSGSSWSAEPSSLCT